MSGSLSDSSALFVSVVLIISAVPVLGRSLREAVSWAYALSAGLLTLLCLGLWLDGRAQVLLMGAWLYWPVTVWWLATVYGRVARRHQRTRGLVVLLLGVLLLCAMALVGGSGAGVERTGRLLPWGRWAVLLGVGFWLAALVNFLLTMRAAVGEPRLRRAAALGVFGCLLPLWPETVAAASGRLPVYSLWFAAALGFVAQMFWAEWLVRHRGRESDLEFERPVAYISVAVFLLGVYLLIIGGVGQAVEWLGGDVRAFFSALGGVMLAVIGLALATSGRLWQRAREYVDRNFYRGEIDFRAEWIQISEELAALPDPRDLGRTLARLFAQRVRSGRVLLYRRVEDGDLELWARVGTDIEVPDRIPASAPWIDWLWRLGTPAEWRTLAASDQPAEFSECSDLAAPMVAKQELVAVAILGDHPGPFSAEERLWLETAGQQAALAVVAAGLTERLIETRELASFHRLSTFVIHDVKNAISMLSLLLQNIESGRGASVDEHVKVTLRQATAKLSSLTERFSGSPESLKLDRRACRLDLVTAEVVSGLKQSFPGVAFVMPDGGEATVYADRDQIARVLENLCINACEAMQGKGTVTIRISVRETQVELAVDDTGPGMDVDFVRERLFRPFVTTKKKGLGIGLYQSREIARAHGGQLKARSQVGSGTTMTLVLPRST